MVLGRDGLLLVFVARGHQVLLVAGRGLAGGAVRAMQNGLVDVLRGRLGALCRRRVIVLS